MLDFLKKKYIIQNPDDYENEEMEIIALTKDPAGSSKMMGDKYRSASMRLLAYIDLNSGRLVESATFLRWDVTDRETAFNGFRHRLAAETGYRLLVRPSKALSKPWGEIPAGRSLFVTKVLRRNVSEPRLDKILEDYRKPRRITLSDGTALDFERNYDRYTGFVSWPGGKSEIVLGADGEDFGNAVKATEVFERIYADEAGWDKRAREFAAKKMTSLANDWRGDDEERPITRAEFARRIGMPYIIIDSDGSITFAYDDDDMFCCHTIVVSGTFEEGFVSADIEG